MKIDQTLNLVTKLDRDNLPVYVYVTPFPYEVVEQYYKLLGYVFGQFYKEVGDLGSVRIAAMMLRDAAKSHDAGDTSIFDEINRFTKALYWDGKKWKNSPIENALNAGIISQDEWRDIEGEVAFFIVGSAIQKKKLIAPMIGRMLDVYGALLTPLSITAYSDSLPMLKTAEAPETILDPDSPEEPTATRVQIPS